MMKYKGYTGVLEIDQEAGILFGEVLGLRDVITFQGETVAEARTSFRDSIDFYLELCTKQGKPPEKPFSGRFLVRIPPTLHRALVEHAAASGTSLNTLVEQTLEAAIAKSSPVLAKRLPKSTKAKPKAAPKHAAPAAKVKSQPAR
jgi:predicted HicB family RNase H-like nuclease